MMDSMLAAHGRMPYRGERKTLVAMAEPYTRTDLDTIPAHGAAAV
jgi:hypothetical protein